jgi:hypothetical protein
MKVFSSARSSQSWITLVAFRPSMLETKSSSGSSPMARTMPSKIFWWRSSSAKNSTMRTRDTGSGARATLRVIIRICS